MQNSFWNEEGRDNKTLTSICRIKLENIRKVDFKENERDFMGFFEGKYDTFLSQEKKLKKIKTVVLPE